MAKPTEDPTTTVTHPDWDGPLEVSADLADAFVHGGWALAQPTPQSTK